MKTSLIGAFLIFLFACTRKRDVDFTQTKKDTGYEQVMYVHDSIMPLTGNLFKLKQKLSSYELQSTDSLRIHIFGVKQIIEDADKAMMSWMRAFEEPQFTLPDSVRNAYYADEFKKISAVGDQMYAAIDSASALLQILEEESNP